MTDSSDGYWPTEGETRCVQGDTIRPYRPGLWLTAVALYRPELLQVAAAGLEAIMAGDCIHVPIATAAAAMKMPLAKTHRVAITRLARRATNQEVVDGRRRLPVVDTEIATLRERVTISDPELTWIDSRVAYALLRLRVGDEEMTPHKALPPP